MSVLEHVIIAAAEEFAPKLIPVSAGSMPIATIRFGGCRLETESFAQMACQVRDLGERLGAPVGGVLEGGYNPTALADCILATVAALGGRGKRRVT